MTVEHKASGKLLHDVVSKMVKWVTDHHLRAVSRLLRQLWSNFGNIRVRNIRDVPGLNRLRRHGFDRRAVK